MAFNRFFSPFAFFVDATGLPLANAYLVFFETDQVTQKTTYANRTLTTPSTTVPIMYNSMLVNAVQADSAGRFPTIFLTPSPDEYFMVLLDEDLNTIKTENYFSVPDEGALNSGQFIVYNGQTYVGSKVITVNTTTYDMDTATSWGKLISFSNPNPIAVTLPAPSSSVFVDGWCAEFENTGVGIVTITSTATIDGALTFTLNRGQGVVLHSDGSIYYTERGKPRAIYTEKGGALTVTTNAVTVGDFSQYLIDTSGAAQTVTTINGGIDGQLVLLKASSVSNALTISNSSGIKLQSGASFVTSSLQDNILLEYDSTNSYWTEVSRSSSLSLSPMVLLSTQTASASALIAFTGLSSTYNSYKIVITDLVAATDQSILEMQLSTDNGSTYVATNYTWVMYFNTPADPVADSSNAGTGGFTTAIALNPTTATGFGVSNVAQDSLQCEVTLFNPSSAASYKKVKFQTTYLGATANIVNADGSGVNSAAVTAINAVKFFMSSGNITSGTFKLYGIR